MSYDLRGQHVHIIGLGAKGTGRACAAVLAQRGALVTVSDEQAAEALAGEIAQLAGLPVRFCLGPDAYTDIEKADLVIPSPGVPLDNPAILRARAAGIPVLAEIEIAYRLSRVPIVAISGTKGKTTTTTLIGLLLAALERPVHVGGNIGIPLIELAVAAQTGDLLVAEISSFQLEAVKRFHPRVAVFTNLYPDHLDRYQGSMEAYFATKLRLFARQTPADIAVVVDDRPESKAVAAATKARVIRVSTRHTIPGGVYVADGHIISEVSGVPVPIMSMADIRLRGAHNLANVLEAIAAVHALGLPVEHVAGDVLREFRGVPNRLEEVATIGDVTYFNDSQGTTPVATEMALTAFTGTPVVLIAGGRAKVPDFSELGRHIAAGAQALVVIGEAGEAIAGATLAAAPRFPVQRAATLPEAVTLATRLAQPGSVVVLSPACASFDMFRNMEHRGDVFRAAVLSLQPNAD
jgi:UDP-N-acetylmuramoylalanine--D-glutamate ligase